MLFQMKILSIRHNWPENPPFLIDRPNGCSEYVLLHFITPILLLHDEKKQMVPAGSCIIYSPGHPQWFFSDKPILHDWMHLEGNIPEMMASVQELYSIVLKDPLAAEHLQNEMRFSIMMKDVYQIIGEATGMGDILG